MFEYLDLLKSYHNKNRNLIRNLYNAISPIKMKRKFLFIFSKEPLNCLPQWKPNKKQLLELMLI